MGRLLLIVAAALVLSAPAWADNMGDRKRALDTRIAVLQGRIASADRKEAVLTDEIEQFTTKIRGLQDDVAQALASARRLTEQGQDLMVLVRHEAGALAQTSRRVRRKLVRGIDRVEDKLSDLETLYDLVHGEVEDAALDVAATLRSVRRGSGVIGRVRRMLVANRS